MTVERISDARRLEAVVGAWDGLAADARGAAAIFRSPTWLLTWWAHFGRGKELDVWLVRSARQVIAVLPAYREVAPLGGRQVRLMGDGSIMSDYLGVVARSAHVLTAAEALAHALLEDHSDLMLDGLAVDDPLVEALEREARRRGSAVVRRPLDECPFLSIPDAGDFAQWLRDRPGGAGAQLRRRRHWLERCPGFRIDVLTSEDDIVLALPALWRLHHARWEPAGGSAGVTTALVESFHAASARALARRGWARLYVLHAQGGPRAALYGFERDGHFAFYQSGRDPTWQQRSVGTVLLGAVLEDVFARGLVEFDFLRGSEAYKALFASASRSLVRVRVSSRAWGRAILLGAEGLAAARSMARELGPPALIAYIRRRRRRARWDSVG